ncbi:hypothetical protein B0T21DRAFT_375663 [Apiosordaria backusii]|uniref:Uncharacterized protein n=1 Tax=Apiosordaria backusii TaxID=314023 RepID=A0AA40AEB4_9PEZI|nr:hypothetical protein B0T21DRAFT_375663 [Apiosordaria backusii]
MIKMMTWLFFCVFVMFWIEEKRDSLAWFLLDIAFFLREEFATVLAGIYIYVSWLLMSVVSFF